MTRKEVTTVHVILHLFDLKRGWKWAVDNELDAYGQTDFENKTIWINLEAHDECDESLVDTCIHETMHVLYPKKTEKQVEELTDLIISFFCPSYEIQMEVMYRKMLQP